MKPNDQPSSPYHTLRAYRLRELKRTQEEVGQRAGKAQAQISRVERGVEPDPWHVQRYLTAYRLSEDEFFRLLAGSAKDAKARKKLKAAKKRAELMGTPEERAAAWPVPVPEELPLFSQPVGPISATVNTSGSTWVPLRPRKPVEKKTSAKARKRRKA